MTGLLRPGPQYALVETGALRVLPDLLVADAAEAVLFVHGTRSLAAAAPHLPDLAAAGIRIVEARFGGECSPGEVDRLRALAAAEGAGAVVGLGGGKALDTAKAVAARSALPVHLLPTLANTCSAWSAVSVFYDDAHRHLGHEVWTVASRSVLIDPLVVFDSPVELFVSGIADTLAKWIEARPLFEAAPAPGFFADLGRQAAAECRDRAILDGPRAVDDMRAGRMTETWRSVMAAAIVTSGLVGGFGGDLGRATAAHPVNDGLSVVAASRDLLHGVKVAYGILVQLALERRWDEIADLREVYARLGLPRRLADVGIDADDVATIARVARVAVEPHSSIHLLRGAAGVEHVVDAMGALEAFQDDIAPVVVAGHAPSRTPKEG